MDLMKFKSIVAILLLILLCDGVWSNCKNRPTKNNNIATFHPVDTKVPATRLPTSYDAQGLQPFFNLAKSFMNTVQPKSFGDQFNGVDIKDLTKGDNLDKLKKYEIPIGVAAGFGLLFALLMPIIGLCFCCCRCCGNCGGKMYQDQKSSSQHTKCCIMAVVLLIVTIFMLCGVLFMFVTNNRLHTETKDVAKTYETALDDAFNIANSTVQQFQSIGTEQLPCITELVMDDLKDNGITLFIGNPIKADISKNLSGVITLALQESSKISNLEDILKNTQATSTTLNSLATMLEKEINMVKTNLSNIVTTCRNQILSVSQQKPCDDLASTIVGTNVDFTSLPNINSELATIRNVINQNFSGNILKAQQVLNDIPKTVLVKSASARSDVEREVDKAQQNVNKEIDKLTKDIDKQVFQKKPDLLKIKDDYLDTKSDYYKYEKCRWYGYIGLSCLMALIIVLMGSGLTLGTCGYRKDRLPSNRTATATCGGNCLMAAVGIMFIFSFIMMMFCVIWYCVGIHVHILCRDVKDGKLIDQLSKDIKFDNQRIYVADTLKNCKANQALYTAVNGVRFFNISEKLDIKKYTSDIDKKIDGISVNLQDQTILTPAAKTALNDLISSGVNNINFTAFFDTLSKQITETNLTEVANNLTSLATSVQSASATVANHIRMVTNDINRIERTTVMYIKTNITLLQKDVTNLQTMSADLQAKAQQILDNLTSSEHFVQFETVTRIKNHVKRFSKRLTGWLEQGSDHIMKQVQTNVVRCKPLADMYDGLVNTFFCDNIVQNTNGFWLAMGWCMLFFIPAIILSVKLGKYFRKMDYDSGYDDDRINHPPYNDKIPLHDRNQRNSNLSYDNHPPPPYNEHQNEGYLRQ